jgi:hypothetical protein
MVACLETGKDAVFPRIEAKLSRNEVQILPFYFA